MPCSRMSWPCVKRMEPGPGPCGTGIPSPATSAHDPEAPALPPPDLVRCSCQREGRQRGGDVGGPLTQRGPAHHAALEGLAVGGVLLAGGGKGVQQPSVLQAALGKPVWRVGQQWACETLAAGEAWQASVLAHQQCGQLAAPSDIWSITVGLHRLHAAESAGMQSHPSSQQHGSYRQHITHASQPSPT